LDLNHFVRELGDSLAQSVGTGVRVELELAADLPSAFADPRAVQLALLELAANAHAAMPNGGRLMLRTAHGPERLLLLEVADSGAGMSADALARMRTPLLSRGQHGKPGGIGLHIVKACLQATGGRVELASSPGAGVSVKLYLPSA
jgi:signal transduction histidine kinase